MRMLLTAVFCLAWVHQGANGAKLRMPLPWPLQAEREVHTNRKIPGCRLGTIFYDLEARWNPALEPIGRMYCVQCTCLPVIKKGSLQRKGKVSCRNIKTACAKLTCSDQVLPPNSCCKVCRGNEHAAQKWFDYAAPTFEEEKLQEALTVEWEFTSLLVGQMLPTKVNTRNVARGHFTLSESSLHYCVHFTKSLKPTVIRYTDEKGSHFFEHQVHTVRGEHKICGVWSSMPKIYLSYLLKGKLFIVLVSRGHPNGEVAGLITIHRALEEETFSSLLVPKENDGSGAIAMLALSEDGNSLSFVIKRAGENSTTPVSVSFEKEGSSIHEMTVIPNNSELVEVWPNLKNSESKQLARGKLAVVVKSKSGKTLRGSITPIQTYNYFQAVLSGKEAFETSSSGSAGSAVLSLLPNGSLKYQIRLQGMNSKVTGVTIEGAPNKHNKRRKVSKILNDFVQDRGSFDGWINGTYGKPNAREIYLLLRERLYINVQTASLDDSALRGKITKLLYHGHLARHIDHPYAMSGSNVVPPMNTAAAGHTWLGVDRSCTLHFEISVSGLSGEHDGILSAHLHGLAELGEVDHEKHDKILLTTFNGNSILGRIDDLPSELYQHLNSGYAFVQISTKAHPDGDIRGNVSVPNNCFATQFDHRHGDILEDMEKTVGIENQQTKCVYDGVIHNNGESWKPSGNLSCFSCSCKKGKVSCHRAVCPPPLCKNPVTVQDECCPVCLEKGKTKPTETCYFPGDKRDHYLGTRWHPYVPPFGYVTCAVCNCVKGSSKFNCTRMECPKLDCTDKESIRKEETDCCRVCPDKKSKPKDEQAQRDNPGGCIVSEVFYENGSEWHPKVQHIGTMKCVTCKCKNGKSKCRRPRCPKLTCKKKVKQEGSCCKVCGDSSITRKNRRRKHRRRSKHTRT
uniref:Chordin n=1 Tax=Novocrania anomala TaxID=317945 RepID=A0A165USQ6_9BILA|nr:chordin [Novocrania anomala]